MLSVLMNMNDFLSHRIDACHGAQDRPCRRRRGVGVTVSVVKTENSILHRFASGTASDRV